MAQRTFGRALAAVALTATLAIALPGQADAAPRSAPVSLWEWVGGFLEERIASLWGRTDWTSGRKESLKSGGCIDPDGCTTGSQLTGAPPRPPCSAWDEAGGCVDPDG